MHGAKQLAKCGCVDIPERTLKVERKVLLTNSLLSFEKHGLVFGGGYKLQDRCGRFDNSNRLETVVIEKIQEVYSIRLALCIDLVVPLVLFLILWRSEVISPSFSLLIPPNALSSVGSQQWEENVEMYITYPCLAYPLTSLRVRDFVWCCCEQMRAQSHRCECWFPSHWSAHHRWTWLFSQMAYNIGGNVWCQLMSNVDKALTDRTIRTMC